MLLKPTKVDATLRPRQLVGLKREAMRAIVGTLVFTVLIPGSVTVLVPYLLLTSGLGLTCEIGNFRFIGIVLLVFGIVFYGWTAWDFAFVGRGTPAPIDPPKVLVSRRLYRIVRNPMYIGVVSILVGEAILFMSVILLAYALAIWSLFHLFVVYYEEPNLRQRFGAAYVEYCKVVPRWIPRIRRVGESG